MVKNVLYIAQKYFPKQIEWLVQVGELSLQKCRVQYGDIDKLACAGSYKNADTRFKATTFHQCISASRQVPPKIIHKD